MKYFKCEMAQYSPLSADDADICLSKTKQLIQNLKDNSKKEFFNCIDTYLLYM